MCRCAGYGSLSYAFARNRESWVVDAFYCDGSTESPGSLHDAPDSGNAFSLMLQKTISRRLHRRVRPRAQDRRARHRFGLSEPRRLRDRALGSAAAAADRAGGASTRPRASTAGASLRSARCRWSISTSRAIASRRAASSGRSAPGRSRARSTPTCARRAGGPARSSTRQAIAISGPGWTRATFRQITSEYLVEETYRGRPRKFWKLRASERDNHWLDTGVMAMALAEHLGLSTDDAGYWAQFERIRGAPAGEGLELWQAAAKAGAEGQTSGGEAPPTDGGPATPPGASAGRSEAARGAAAEVAAGAPPEDDWRAAVRRPNEETRKGAPAGAGWPGRRPTDDGG